MRVQILGYVLFNQNRISYVLFLFLGYFQDFDCYSYDY